MKFSSKFILATTLVGGLLFTYLFWMERLALNLFIYSLFITTIITLNSQILKNRQYFIFMALHLFAAVMVVVVNSNLSIAAYYISLLVYSGYAHYALIKTAVTAFFATFLQMVCVPYSIIMQLGSIKKLNFAVKPFQKTIKYVIVPFILISIFITLYANANQIFGHYVSTLFDNIELLLNNLWQFLFRDLSIERVFHLIFGVLITGGLIITLVPNKLSNIEVFSTDQLQRKSDRINHFSEFIEFIFGKTRHKKMALKTEYKAALILFSGLNLLLILINLIDIGTIWFGYTPKGNFSADVHAGTSALITSTILAMAIILYYFRGNLNFFTKSGLLRKLVYLWIVQNLILVVSLILRDKYYIDFQGLTYKRIGVLVFAALCAFGLISVYFKVAKQKTFFYLVRTNTFAWFFTLIAASTINWDKLIFEYNINTQLELDIYYLMTLSDKTLPLLDKNKVRLFLDNDNQDLNRRIKIFKERYQQETWLSWNFSDQQTATYFNIKK